MLGESDGGRAEAGVAGYVVLGGDVNGGFLASVSRAQVTGGGRREWRKYTEVCSGLIRENVWNMFTFLVRKGGFLGYCVLVECRCLSGPPFLR